MISYFQYVIRFHVAGLCLNTISFASIRRIKPSLHRFLRNVSVHNSIKWKSFIPDFHPTHQSTDINPLNAELNPICYLLALLGAHHFLHVSRIGVKSLTLRQLMSYIYGALILDVSRSHTTTCHSR